MSNRSRAWGAGLLLAGAAEVYLAHRSSGPGGILERRFSLLGLIMLWWGISLVAVLCAFKATGRWVTVVVLLLAVAVRIAALSPKAPLSDDLYRYAWDGSVQAHGIDPYAHAPIDPSLAFLRTPWLFPSGKTDHHGTWINRGAVRTIYPPVAEAWFTAEHYLVPQSLRDRGYEGAGLVLDLAILAVLLTLLRDRRWIAVWALVPLPALEIVQNAHVDGLAVLLTVLALAVEERGRRNGAVVLLALATLTKLYPAVLLPVLLREREGRWRRLALFVGVCAVSYAPHVLAVGPDIIGYLPGYLHEESYASGTRYLMLGLLGLSGTPASAIAVLLLLALAFWGLRTTLPLRQAALVMMVGVLLVATPVQPWYAGVLLALVVLAEAWWALALTAAAYPLFFGSVLYGGDPTTGKQTYGAAVLIGRAVLLLQRRQRHRSRADDERPQLSRRDPPAAASVQGSR